MEFTYEIFLYAYYALVGLFALFALFNLYHLAKYGFTSFLAFFLTFLFLAGTILIIFETWQYISVFDWQQTLSGIQSNNISYFP